MLRWKDFQGVNFGFALGIYEHFLKDHASVDAETCQFFERSPPPENTLTPGGEALRTGIGKIVGAVNLAECIHKFGHMGTRIDPLGSPSRRQGRRGS
jgi:2-oxoglutarate dehydrogenase complex dehydrogenase (E1) component-like enzyme